MELSPQWSMSSHTLDLVCGHHGHHNTSLFIGLISPCAQNFGIQPELTHACVHSHLVISMSVSLSCSAISGRQSSKQRVYSCKLESCIVFVSPPSLLLALKSVVCIPQRKRTVVLVYTDNTTKVLTEGIFSPFPHNTHWSVWKQMAQTSRTSLTSLSTTWP